MPEFNDEQLLRYSRQLMLPEIGIEGQSKLANSCVLIVGLGGLGSPAAMYLAASGVGKLILADGDLVEASNLQRQIIHSNNNIGKRKTDSAKQCLQGLNPDTEIETYGHLSGTQLLDCVRHADIVLDGSDNFATRYALNEACASLHKPLVSGAAIRLEAQVSVFTYSAESACYECLYPRGSEVDENCVQNGVIAPLVGIIGCIQALEAIKLIVDFGEHLLGRLLLFDAAKMKWKEVQLTKNSACPVCARSLMTKISA